MENSELIQNLTKQLEIQLPQPISEDELLQKLSEFINQLIKTDFEKLVFILYKADVSESKLKQLLQQNSYQDASPVIAKLIIEREREKIYSRSRFRKKEDIPDDEKW
ncbi:MAG: hypothetical protein ABIO55_17700 [Ginsengibacter sp.]